MAPKNLLKQGEAVYAKMGKMSSEMLALMYGSLVTQVVKDSDNVDVVNQVLHSLGRDMGARLIEEVFAKTNLGVCDSFGETCEVVAQVAFKMYWGIAGEVSEVTSAENPTYDLLFSENPLAEFVELPTIFEGKLVYSQIICGTIEGALEQIHLRTKATILRDVPDGDDGFAIRLELLEVMKDKVESDS